MAIGFLWLMPICIYTDGHHIYEYTTFHQPNCGLISCASMAIGFLWLISCLSAYIQMSIIFINILHCIMISQTVALFLVQALVITGQSRMDGRSCDSLIYHVLQPKPQTPHTPTPQCLLTGRNEGKALSGLRGILIYTPSHRASYSLS